MIVGTRHIGLVVRDIERALHFYQALGFTVHKRETEQGDFIDTVIGTRGERLEWVKLKAADGSLLELLQYHVNPDSQPMADAPSNKLGCSHVAYTVKNVARTCEEIVRLGGTMVNPPALAPNGLAKVAYCHDLDGILMEVVEEVETNG